MGKPKVFFRNNQMPFHNQRVKNRRDADKLITTSWRITLLLALWALHDDFGFGNKRLSQFIAKVFDLLDSYTKGYVSIDDLRDTLKKETNIDISTL